MLDVQPDPVKLENFTGRIEQRLKLSADLSVFQKASVFPAEFHFVRMNIEIDVQLFEIIFMSHPATQLLDIKTEKFVLFSFLDHQLQIPDIDIRELKGLGAGGYGPSPEDSRAGIPS
jgi:hypothetical protein